MTLHHPTLPDYVGVDRTIGYGDYPANSAMGHLRRGPGIQIEQSIRIVFGPGQLEAPVLQFTGSVLVLDQYAILTDAPALADCTDVHSDVWDDVANNPKKLNKGNPGGIDLSNAPVGSFGTRGSDSTQPYVVLYADESRFFEPDQRTVGFPFVLNANPNANNFLRFQMTMGTLCDFTLLTFFEFVPLAPGSDMWFFSP